MVQIYVDLIKKGLKTIDDVPEKIREQVGQALNDSTAQRTETETEGK